jgi:hypothetical protein
LEKAFHVVGEEEKCSLAQVHSIFDHFLFVVPVTHRLESQSKEWVHPYPMARLEQACQGLETTVTWEQLCQALSAECMEWLSCPLYQLEVYNYNVGSFSRWGIATIIRKADFVINRNQQERGHSDHSSLLTSLNSS